MDPLHIVLLLIAGIVGGDLKPAPEEASDVAFFPRAELPPLAELAWPSTAHGVDTWRAFETPRP